MRRYAPSLRNAQVKYFQAGNERVSVEKENPQKCWLYMLNNQVVQAFQGTSI